MNIPSFSITRILELRDRLTTRVFYPRFGQTVEGPVIDELVNALLAELPDGIKVDPLYETVRQLVPLQLTDKSTQPWAWRIAANVPQLKAGHPVRVWTRQSVDEWVPIQVIHMAPTRTRHGKFGYNVDFRILAGTPAPMSIQKFWSTRSLHALSRRVGFTWSDGPRPYRHPTEFTQLRMVVLLEAARSQERPFFHKVDCSGNMLDYNKDIQDRRHKVKYPCPWNWRHPCHLCAVGYDQCAAGTHFHTYEMRECTQCGTTAPFEPNHEHCVNCTRKEALRHGQSRS